MKLYGRSYLSAFSTVFILSLVFAILTGCKTRNKNNASVELTNTTPLTHYTEYLRLNEVSNGLIIAEIINPWDTTTYLGKYILADKNIKDEDIPALPDFKLLRTPVESALVYSSVHTSPMEELGATEIITAVADAQYFYSPAIKQRLKEGKIKDVGSSMSPSLEKIIETSPQVAIVSPYQNSSHGILDKTGIEVIDMADYMERTPLGRAEWILFLGALSGKITDAQSLFNHVADEYTSIKKSVSQKGEKPVVLTEIPYSGVWYQPGAGSFMGSLIHDAGGKTLLSDTNQTGSVQLDIANVLEKGSDAEVWLIQYPGELTADELSRTFNLAKNFRSFNSRNVWYVNTSGTNFYDTLAFHPELILADFVRILNSAETDSNGFYKRVPFKSFS